MSYSVHITARALADVDAAVARIARHAPQAASNWHARLLAKIQLLEDNPQGCPLAAKACD